MSDLTATVEVLTAEVRTLMVGSRQVTQSVFKQLDFIEPEDIDPFGRVSNPKSGFHVDVVGRDPATGALVRSGTMRPSLADLRQAAPYSGRDNKIFRVGAVDYTEGCVPTWPRWSDTVAAARSGDHTLTWQFQDRDGYSVWVHDPDLEPRQVTWNSVEARERAEVYLGDWVDSLSLFKRLADLPLIVLAGLR